jgi:hypothetical protein
MEILFSILTLVGMGYAAFVGVKWMLKAGQLVQRRELPLSPTDLKVLEQTAARLAGDLRAAADECVARVELALAEAERRIAALGPQHAAADSAASTSNVQVSEPPLFAANALQMIGSNRPAADAARQSGLTTGEVELLRGLSHLSCRGAADIP